MVPFLGYPKYQGPYFNRDPKRDHNFDNHLCVHLPSSLILSRAEGPKTFKSQKDAAWS